MSALTPLPPLFRRPPRGAALGYVPIGDISKIDDLIVAVRPANINLFSDREVSELEQNVCRAAKCTSALLEAAK